MDGPLRRLEQAEDLAWNLRSCRHGGLLRRAQWEDGPWAGAGQAAVWPLGQVWHAELLLLLARGGADPDAADRVAGDLDAYRSGGSFRPFPRSDEVYFDDNAWIGLAAVQQHLLGGVPGALELAMDVLELLARRGEEADGGIRWRDVPGSPRNTCSTAPAIELALRLHLLTGDDGCLAFAARHQRFLDEVLRRDDDLYADHVDGDGTVEHSLWSYNQGTPVGADALWFRVTGERTWLDLGGRTVDAALAFYGDDDRLWRQPPVFNAIFLRNLLAFDAVRGTTVVTRVLDAYLDRVWADARDPATGWCDRGGIGRYERGGTIDQAGLVQLFALASVADRPDAGDRLVDVC